MSMSNIKRGTIIDGYTAAVFALFKKGIYDPSTDEIAEEYSKGLLLPDVVLDDVRKSLGQIRQRLKDGYGISTMLVNRIYYASFRHVPLEDVTEVEARQSIAGCSGRRDAYGIRKHVGGDDDIFYTTYEADLGNKAGKRMEAGAGRLKGAVEHGAMTREHASGIVDQSLAPAVSAARQLRLLHPNLSSQKRKVNRKGLKA